MFARCPFHLRLLLPLIFIHTTCVLLSLRQTSAPIHLTSVLGGLGTQETCCCPTNLCTWRPNTVYKNRSVRRHQAIFWHHCRGGKESTAHHTPSSTQRHQAIFWRFCRGGERLKVFPLDSAILSFCFLFLF